MGGSATAAGIRHQANAIAVVYVHVLGQRRLAWFGDGAKDVPVGVLGETDGPGDDIKIEFGGGFPTAEAQAKHRLNGGAGVDEVLNRVVTKSKDGDTTAVAIVVGAATSFAVHFELADDLDRLRSGRDDVLHAEARRLLDAGRDPALLGRIYIVRQELDRDRDPGLHAAHTLLSTLLEDQLQTKAAWAVLEADAGQICAKQLRRTAKELREILDVAGIRLRPPERDARLARQLDEVEELLQDGAVGPARQLLRRIRTSIESSLVAPSLLVRFDIVQAVAAIDADDSGEALRLAEKATSADTKSVAAHAVAAIAALKLGDFGKAGQMADRAVALDSNDPMAWRAKVQVEAAGGGPIPEVPPTVAATVKHRQTLVVVAINRGDWETVLSLTRGLLDDHDRSYDTLRYRCLALLNAPESGGAEARLERRAEVELLATELIDKHEADDPAITDALTARGVARRDLGREDAAQEDFDRAYSLRPTDENAVRNRAASLAESGRSEEALSVLRSSSSSNPLLLANRAMLRFAAGDAEGAKVDLVEAARRVTVSEDQVATRTTVSMAMALTGDVEGALRVLKPLSPEEGGHLRLYALGVVAFAQGRVDDGEHDFRTAAAGAPPELATHILKDLGVRLYHAQRYTEAVAAFEAGGGLALTDEPRQFFAAALMAANNLVRAQALVNDEANKGPLPHWARAVAVDIALRSDDLEGAIDRLTELADESTGANVKIALAKALIDAGRLAEATEYVDELAADSAKFEPANRIQVAELSSLVGRQLESVTIGFRAYRDAPHNPQIQRSFASLLFNCEETIPAPSVVGPDTFVRLRDERGEIREHTIYSDGPIDPLRGEMTIDDASKAGLLGKKVGERLHVEGDRDWTDKGWIVEAIVPPSVHAAQDIVQHYAERFPGEPFFAASVHIGDGSDIKDFVPIIGAVKERQEWVANVLTQTRDQLLPLGVAAKLIGASIRDLMVSAKVDPTKAGPLIVEWPSEADQQSSAANAAQAVDVVLTRSSIHSLRELGLLDKVAANYTLVAPRSLEWELREELAKAEKDAVKGSSTLLPGPAGFQLQEFKPNDPGLVRRRDELATLTSWLTANVTVKPRPLSMVFGRGSDDGDMRERIGHSSFDAVALATDSGAMLYADDIGLRRVAIQDKRPGTFSSVTLLPVLATRGIISEESRDELLLRLIEENYAIIRPTPEMLAVAVRRASPMTYAELERVFVRLASEGVTPLEAARIASATLRALAVHPAITTVTIETVVDLSIRAMALRAPKPLCAQLLMRAAENDLALLPIERERVRRECAAEARR